MSDRRGCRNRFGSDQLDERGGSSGWDLTLDSSSWVDDLCVYSVDVPIGQRIFISCDDHKFPQIGDVSRSIPFHQ